MPNRDNKLKVDSSDLCQQKGDPMNPFNVGDVGKTTCLKILHIGGITLEDYTT